jgi:hypothetical protein
MPMLLQIRTAFDENAVSIERRGPISSTSAPSGKLVLSETVAAGRRSIQQIRIVASRESPCGASM